VRHEEDRLYREELDELAAKHPHFRVFYSISQPAADWAGSGRRAAPVDQATPPGRAS